MNIVIVKIKQSSKEQNVEYPIAIGCDLFADRQAQQATIAVLMLVT